jgi:hypothetical protein
MTRLFLAAVFLASCTTTQQAGLRKAFELSVEGCRAYLTAYPDAKGRVGQVCRKLVS